MRGVGWSRVDGIEWGGMDRVGWVEYSGKGGVEPNMWSKVGCVG